MASRFVIYKDAKGEFRWRFHASSGQILAESGEGFINRANCQHTIILMKREAAEALVNDDLRPASSVRTV